MIWGLLGFVPHKGDNACDFHRYMMDENVHAQVNLLGHPRHMDFRGVDQQGLFVPFSFPPVRASTPHGHA
jgi:hypothetical protein